jgi:hypothetical protein
MFFRYYSARYKTVNTIVFKGQTHFIVARLWQPGLLERSPWFSQILALTRRQPIDRL